MNVALPPLREMNRNEQLLVRLEQGRYLYEAGFTRSACRNQDEEAGYDAAAGAPVDGWLQQEIDYAGELEDYEEWVEDNIWHSRGGW